MQTSLHELIEILKCAVNFLDNPNDTEADKYASMAYKDAIKQAEQLLGKEESQIVGAYMGGKMGKIKLPYGLKYINNRDKAETEAQDYFNKNYSK